MQQLDDLLKKLPQTPFTSKEATLLGVGQYYLKQLVAGGYLEKMRRGVYQRPKSSWGQEDSFRAVTSHLNCPSCICLWSALSYYKLTEEVPDSVWIYVPFGKYSHSPGIRVVRQRNPNWKIGVVKKNGFQITSLERTLVEAISDTRHIPKKDAVDALNLLLKEKKIKMSKLISMAKSLGIYHKISSFLEAFA